MYMKSKYKVKYNSSSFVKVGMNLCLVHAGFFNNSMSGHNLYDLVK